MQLVIDGYGGEREKLTDAPWLYQFLDDYPTRIGMTKISTPFVLRYQGGKAEDWGFSGFVLIAESHISIHTFPERNYVNIDIFSCKDFDAEEALRDISRLFGFSQTRSCLLDRGLNSSGDGRARLLAWERLPTP